jgi:hypothetical protein
LIRRVKVDKESQGLAAKQLVWEYLGIAGPTLLKYGQVDHARPRPIEGQSLKLLNTTILKLTY